MGNAKITFSRLVLPKHQQMAALPVDDIRRLSDLHPKPVDIGYQYGTAGFRTSCVLATL